MATGGAARSHWPRRAAAAVLAATFIILAPVAVASAWIRGTVLSTSGYVAAVSDVAASPAVRTVIREAVTAEVSAALPRAGGALAGPLRARLADLAGQAASGGLTVITVTLLSGPYRWAAAIRRYLPARPFGGRADG